MVCSHANEKEREKKKKKKKKKMFLWKFPLRFDNHALTKMRNKRCRHSGLKETAFVELSELLCLVQLE